MRNDEAFTFLNYANGDFPSLFNYSDPNNHVLNTLLIKLSTTFFGASPASIRFPAFLAGLAAIACAFYLARSMGKNRNSGILVAIAIAVFPYLILYSTNARGYSLLLTLTLMIAFMGDRFSNNPSKSGVILLALLSALGMLAIPVMILPIAGIFFWVICLLFVKKFSLKTVLSQFAIPFALLSGIFTLVFYTPVIIVSGGVAPIISNQFVLPQSWDIFLAQLIPSLQKSFDELSRDVPPLVLLAIFALAALGIVHAARRRSWGLLLILPCLFLGAFVVLLIQHTNPYARAWIYFLPFLLLAADAGLARILDYLPNRIQLSLNVFLTLAGLFFALNLMSKNIISAYPDTGAFPEAPIAVEYLRPILKPDDSLRVSPTAQWPVYFYFWYDGIPQPNSEQNPTSGRLFFIAKKSRGPLSDAAAQRFTLLLDVDNMALYQEQR